MATTTNTHFTILRANEEGEMEVVFYEIKRTKVVPFSLRLWFESQLGKEVKFTMWSDGDEEATVIGRGGKMNAKFL